MTLKTLTVLALSMMLSACVTVTESRLTSKASPTKAVENYTRLGLGYLETHPDWSRKHLSKALSIDSKYAPANDAMGQLWMQEGEYELAEEFFRKAIRYDSKFTVARHHLGQLYTKSKRYDAAEKSLLAAAKDPYYEDRAEAYADLALAFYHQDDNLQAIEMYKQSLRIDPHDVTALVNISTLCFEEQDFKHSQFYFDRLDRLVKHNKASHSAHSLWLGVKLATIVQNTERAIALASDLKRYYPDSNEFKEYRESLSGVQ